VSALVAVACDMPSPARYEPAALPALRDALARAAQDA
jgi:hypothetical protein